MSQAAKKAGKSADDVAASWKIPGEVQGLRGARGGQAQGHCADRNGRDEVGVNAAPRDIGGRPRCCCWATPPAFTPRRRAPPSRSRLKLRGYVVPRTQWGRPRSQTAIWPSIDMVRVPVQRASQYGTRLFMTVEEHAAIEKTGTGNRIARMAAGLERGRRHRGRPVTAGRVGASRQLQTSLLFDPSDGRMPSMTPAGTGAPPRPHPKARSSARSWTDPKTSRCGSACISRAARLGSDAAGPLQQRQSTSRRALASWAIRYEMIHDIRIIPIGRPLPIRILGSSIKQYMGDARGHFEGDHTHRRDDRLHREDRRRLGARRDPEQFCDAPHRALHARLEGHDSLRGDGQRSGHLDGAVDRGVFRSRACRTTACSSTRATKATTAS